MTKKKPLNRYDNMHHPKPSINSISCWANEIETNKKRVNRQETTRPSNAINQGERVIRLASRTNKKYSTLLSEVISVVKNKILKIISQYSIVIKVAINHITQSKLVNKMSSIWHRLEVEILRWPQAMLLNLYLTQHLLATPRLKWAYTVSDHHLFWLEIQRLEPKAFLFI